MAQARAACSALLLLAGAAVAVVVARAAPSPVGGDLSTARLSFAPSVSTRARAAAASILPRAWSRPHPGSGAVPVVKLQHDRTLAHEEFVLRWSSGAANAGAALILAASSDRGFVLGAGRLLRELRVHSRVPGGAEERVLLDLSPAW